MASHNNASLGKRKRVDQEGETSSGKRDQEGRILFVKGLHPETTDSDLRESFGKFGELEYVCYYASRNFAFIHFKCKEDAQKAKDGMMGKTIRSHPIRVEYAKQGKSGNQLWIGGLSSAAAKGYLESECLRFGKLQELKFLRDGKSAMVSYFRVEDAAAALRDLNGKTVGGETLRVDYLRSQASRREHLNEFQGARNAASLVPSNARWMPPNEMPRFPGSHNFTHGMNQPFPSFVGPYKEGPPSKFLWISCPPSAQITSKMIHNALILFGEIETITFVPQEQCVLIEFRSPEEARMAKEGLQGRLFNDPRFQILFFGSEGNLHPPSFLGTGVPRTGPFPPNAFRGDWMLPRPFPRAQGGGPLFPRDFGRAGTWSPRNFVGPDVNMPTRGHLPASEAEPPVGSISGSWDHVPRAFGAPVNKAPSVPHGPFPVREPYPVREERPQQSAAEEFFWRGIIAKGGIPICHARCVHVGKRIDTTLPETVDFNAKTGLDILTSRCSKAVSIDVVFFLPDSEDDFSSYTEFLRYLSGKNRAGVAQFEDGTTMFIVPPSDFLKNVLKISGHERLYGVVPKFPEPSNEFSQPPRQFSHAQSASTSYAIGSHVGDASSSRVAETSHASAWDPSMAASHRQATSHSWIQAQNLVSSSGSHQSMEVQTQNPVQHSAQAYDNQPSIQSQYPQYSPSNPVSFQTFGGEHALGSVSGWQHAAIATAPPAAGLLPSSQGANYSVPGAHQFNQPESSNVSQTNYNLGAADGRGISQGASIPPQTGPPASVQPQFGFNAHGQLYHPAGADKRGAESSGDIQAQLPLNAAGTSQAADGSDAEKMQRYQSTLQLAANLLLQIQQSNSGGTTNI